ncbi:MAG: hypothetical protein JW885_02915 [Deltaproteobacteria bacterium]|nr:hypothetical protein [Candidatus Zymogenaceae bacterium]
MGRIHAHQKRELAKSLLGAHDREVICHGPYVSAWKNGERESINWTKLPLPQYVVNRVMRHYRRFERHVAMLLGGTEIQSYEWEIEKEAKLRYIGLVLKEVDGLSLPGSRIVLLMHPPDNQDIGIGDIMDETGLSQARIHRIYDRCVKILAVRFLAEGLFFENVGEAM